MSAQTPIPIFVMSYNDLVSLRLCLRALVRRTMRAHTITVVDNASTDPRLRRYLRLLGRLTRMQVVLGRWNLWVLGLNGPVRAWAKQAAADDLFAVTDCDILVPPVQHGQCWLQRLESTMRANAAIGKLGLALDLGYIKTRDAFAHTYRREKFFMEGPRIEDLVVAPVDTTMALYRRNVFVTDLPWFVPPHQSLYRPYYYCCRTTGSFQAKHLSWRFYDRREDRDVIAKLWCFGFMGATAVPALYERAPAWMQAVHFTLKPLARLWWGSVVLALHLRYAVQSFPRNFNRIQASRRA